MSYLFRPITGEYDYICEFQEGLAFVRNNGEEFRVGFIDKTGKVIIPLDYYGRFGRDTFVHYPAFNEGLAPLISKDGKFGYVDKKGKIIIPFEYDFTYVFSDGLAAVKKDDKWGFIDKTGKIVIPFEYDRVVTGTFNEGLVTVSKNGKWGSIDKTGAVVIPFTLEDADIFIEGETTEKESDLPFSTGFDEITAFREGFAVVKKDGRYGYIDETGKVVIPIEYDMVTRFSEGLAAARKDGKWTILEIQKKDDNILTG